jgi:hypothetical protein
MIEVPEDILWDYDTALEDVLWRLQRIADFFPLYGKERATIAQLYAHRHELKVDEATLALIETYHALLEAKGPKQIGMAVNPNSRKTFPNKEEARIIKDSIRFHGA